MYEIYDDIVEGGGGCLKWDEIFLVLGIGVWMLLVWRDLVREKRLDGEWVGAVFYGGNGGWYGGYVGLEGGDFGWGGGEMGVGLRMEVGWEVGVVLV